MNEKTQNNLEKISNSNITQEGSGNLYKKEGSTKKLRKKSTIRVRIVL